MSERQGVPNVAIVVVSWNGLQDTLTCLTALRRLEHAERCVVLVDNGSRDGTVDVVRRYFPEVEVIANASNLGYVRANNQGIAWGLDRGADWILLLNNDVAVTPGALTEMLRVGESVPEVGIVGPVMQRTLRPDILDLGGDLHFAWGGVSLRRYTDAQRGRDWLPVDYVSAGSITHSARQADFSMQFAAGTDHPGAVPRGRRGRGRRAGNEA